MTDGDILDLKPDLPDFRKDVLKGLQNPSKWIHPKFFYDSNGSLLFDKITELPEYYQTRTENSLLIDKCRSLSKLLKDIERAVELGAGNGQKSFSLIKCLPGLKDYTLLDISISSLKGAVNYLKTAYPQIDIRGVCTDYLNPETMYMGESTGKSLIVFLGSTIGNMEKEGSIEFLKSCNESMSRGDSILIGVDMKKDKAVLEKAYNDSSGITARFNLNLIERIKREFGVSIPDGTFVHKAFYNEEIGRIEMHLVCTRDFSMNLDCAIIRFSKGEEIHTENSYKYTPEEFTEMLSIAGFSTPERLTDAKEYYSIFIARKP
ncbi:MAG: L-histidine N(alpha)-methyltransferase [Thermoplasmata archaeon]